VATSTALHMSLQAFDLASLTAEQLRDVSLSSVYRNGQSAHSIRPA
jgi:hypothetical protein